jgi:hypothetical protein
MKCHRYGVRGPSGNDGITFAIADNSEATGASFGQALVRWRRTDPARLSRGPGGTTAV